LGFLNLFNNLEGFGNPDGGFLAPSAVVKRPAVIDFDKIYLKINLTPMSYGGQVRKTIIAEKTERRFN
jgi:hypothetical protein